MKKRLLALLLAMLMVLSVVLTACGPTKIEPGENPGAHEHEQTTDKEDEGPEQTAQCTHAVTEKKNVKAATCLEEGYTGDDVCTACGEIVTAGSAIAKVACDWGEPQVTLKATCLRPGVATYTCSMCLGTKSTSVAPLGHNLEYVYADGSTHSVTCLNGCLYSEHENHVPRGIERPYAATCLEPAYREGTCKICEEVYRIYSTDPEEQATGHDWSEWVTTPATCAAAGSRSRTCRADGCNASESVEIPVMENAHVWVEAEGTVHATCRAAGLIKWECENPECDATKADTVEARLPHNLGEETVNGGFATQACQNGGCTHKVTRTVVVEGQTSTTVTSDAIKENVAEGDAFEVKTDKVAIQFPADVVDQMTGTEGQDVAISADTLDENAINAAKENMSEGDKALFESTAKGTVYDFNASVGGTAFDANNAFSKPVMITVPYVLSKDDPATEEDEGEDPDGIYIWYMADDGTIEKVLATFVCENEGTGEGYVWFELDHFSRYAIAYEETQEIRCRKGIHVWSNKGEPVEVGCVNPGYQMRECTSCHLVDFTDWVEPTGHDWEYGTVDPTCTEPGYAYRECSKCDANETIVGSQVRPTGHTPSGEISCESDVICTDCRIVLVRGGHEWSEWVTVVEPTEINQGLRRRNCSKCGKVENIELAPTGNVEKWEAENWDELLQLILGDILGIEAGTLKMNVAANMEAAFDTDFLYTISKENGKYVLLIESTMDIDGRVETLKSLYRNGMFIDMSENDDVFAWADAESQFLIPVKALLAYIEQILDMIDEPASMIFATGNELFTLVNDSFGAAVDAKLAAAGSTAKVADIKATLDSLQTVYAYLTMKLGYPSVVTTVNGVKVPTKADLAATAQALMTKTENGDGTVTYTWNPDALVSDINAVLDWILENKDEYIGDLIYAAIGADLVARYPELVDWDAVDAKLRTEFPGTMLVKDAVDKLLTIVETAELGTIANVYALINKVAVMFGADPAFDIEAMITQNYNVTLDDLLAQFMPPQGTDPETGDPMYLTMTMLYDMFYGAKLSGMSFSSPDGDAMALPEMAEMAKGMLASLLIDADIVYTVDAEGKLVSFTFDQAISMVGETEPDAEPAEPFVMQSASIEIVADPSAVIEISDAVKEIATAKVESSYNANDDLVVKVPTGYEIDFEIYGRGDIALDKVLLRDNALSTEFGCDVYVLPEGVGDDGAQNNIGSYVQYNGEYYEVKSFNGYNSTTMKIVESVLMSEITLSDILPDSNETPTGYYEDKDTGAIYFVYRTMLMPMVNMDGTWYMFSRYTTNGGEYFDEFDAYLSRIDTYDPTDLRVFGEDEVAALYYSNNTSFSSYADRWATLGDKTVKLEVIYLGIRTDAWTNVTVPAYTYIDADGNILMAAWEHQVGIPYVELGDKVAALPAHDFKGENVSDEERMLIFADGTSVVTNYTVINLYENEIVCYVEVADGVYVNLDELTTKPLLLGNTVQLPDGNVLDVNRTKTWYETPDYTEVLVGYVQCGELYAEAAAYMNGESVVKVVYKAQRTSIYGDYDDCFNVNDYITGDKTNGFVIDADLLALLDEICPDNSNYGISVACTKELNGAKYACITAVLNEWKVGELQLGGIRDSHGETHENIFENGSSGDVQFVKNADGSISLYYQNYEGVQEIELSYRIDGHLSNRFPVLDDEHFNKNEEKSEQTGLEIYDALISEESQRLIYKNGKYYGYRDYPILDNDYTTLKDLIANHWYIDDMAYFCSTTYDVVENDELISSTPIDVYRARMSFTQNFYWGYSYATVYLAIKEDKVHVMTNATEEAENKIRYDDIVPISTYFDALAETVAEPDSQYSSYNTYFEYVGGQLVERQACGISVKIENSFTTVWYYQDGGVNNFVHTGSSKGTHRICSDTEVTVDIANSNIVTYEEYGFTMAHIITLQYRTYVKLAGLYYEYEWYVDHLITEEHYNVHHSARDWYYICNGMMYNAVTYDSVTQRYTLSEPLEVAPDLQNVAEEPFGYDQDDNEITLVIGTVNDGSVAPVRLSETLDDGTVFYYFEGETEGYLKTQAGTYTRVIKITDGDSVYYYCPYMKVATITDYALAFSGYFDGVISLNKHNTVLTITQEFVDMIPDTLQEWFRVRVSFVDEDGINWNTEYLEYADLVYYLTEWNGNSNGEGGNDFNGNYGEIGEGSYPIKK